MTDQKKKVFLHIGTHKTGTTSIQSGLTINREALKDGGWYIPEKGNPFPRIIGHHNIAWEFLDDSRYSKENGSIDELIIEIEQASQPNIIISAEGFCKFSANQIKALSTKFLDFDVRIIIYLRRQDLYWQSKWVSGIKDFSIDTEFNEWQNQIPDYLNLLDSWAVVFGMENINLRIFEKRQLNSHLFYDFLSSCGVVNFQKYTLPQRVNVSPGIKTLKFLYLVNKGTKQILAKSSIQKTITRSILTYTNRYGWNKVKVNFLTRTISAQIMEAYFETNKIIAQKYLSRDDLFYDAFEEEAITEFEFEEYTQEEVFYLWLKILTDVLESHVYVSEQDLINQQSKIVQIENENSKYRVENRHLKKKIAEMQSTRGWLLLEKFRSGRAWIKKWGRKTNG